MHDASIIVYVSTVAALLKPRIDQILTRNAKLLAAAAAAAAAGRRGQNELFRLDIIS